jgi:hypothetical protein
VKTHAISDMPRKGKVSYNFSPFFFIIKKNANIICKARSKPVKLDDANTEKIVARPAFFVFPNKYLQRSLKIKGGQKPNWFLDCIQNITSQIQAIKSDALGLGTKS